MIAKHASSRRPHKWNGQRRKPPVEALSARVFRLRIACGYSVYELAEAAAIPACTIQRLESGKAVDKRALPALTKALGVPYCRLLCGEHSCTERSCVQRACSSGDAEPTPRRCFTVFEVAKIEHRVRDVRPFSPIKSTRTGAGLRFDRTITARG
jgi:transcriptional regulator with XRE-family HTH domain